MLPDGMLRWGGEGSAIRHLSAYGARRAGEVGAENVFDFAIGSPSAPPPEALSQALEELLSSVPPARLHAYAPAPGIPSVRAAVAEHLGHAFSVAYRPEDIAMTAGASAGLALLTAALLSPGEEVLIPTPAFPEYWVYVEAAGGRVRPVPCLDGSFRLDLAAMERAVTERTVLVILNSPNNPSGAVYPREDLERLADILSRKERELGHPIYLLADEPYRELVFDGAEVPFLPALYRDTVYCYSFSKSLTIPGERVGYLAFHPELAQRDALFSAVQGAARRMGHLCVSPLFQLAAARCLGETAEVSCYQRNRDLICGGLQALGYRFPRPQGAFYLLLQAPEGDGRAFSRRCMVEDVLVVPSEEFFCPGYARLAFCVPEERLRRSLPAFRRIAESYGLAPLNGGAAASV